MKYVLHIESPIKAATRLIICMLLVLIAGTSCLREIEEIKTLGPQEQVTDKEVNFSIRLPSGPVTPQSKAITEEEENYISSLYILSFRIEAGNSEKFDYWTKAVEKEGNVNGDQTQSYSATLKVRNHPQRLVLLTNISETTVSGISQGNWKDAGKELMLATLEEDLLTSGNKWNATSPSDYRSLPMWGESTPQTINTTTTHLDEAIPLLRMVAGVDVQVDETVSGLTEKFKLTSVRLYNINYKGCVVPAGDNVNDFTVENNRSVTVHTPTIPADIAGYSHRHKGPLLYDDFSMPGMDGVAMVNVIYLFEAASAPNYLEATCLVIGGYYAGDPYETYYRVDFKDNDGNTFRDILRNHKYIVHIKDVKQPGYPDPGDAFNSKDENIKVSITEWDEGNINEVIIGGKYYFSVSPIRIEYGGAGKAGNRIEVKTDYPEWSFVLSDSSEPGDPAANPDHPDWITVTSHTAGAIYPGNGTTEYIVYNVAEMDDPERTAYMHVTAGRITMTVVVHQSHLEELNFLVEPTGYISAPGGIRRVKALGSFEHIDVRARDLSNGEFTVTGTITKNVDDDAVDLLIPPFRPTGGQHNVRTIAFEYYDPDAYHWEIIRTDSQLNDWFTIDINHPYGQYIYSEGEQFTVEVRGEFPIIYLRSASEGTALVESTPIPAGSASPADPAVGSIEVPQNPDSRGRMIDLQYSTDRITWITLSSGFQITDHVVIDVTGRIIAREQLDGKYTWYEAMGLSSLYWTKCYYRTYGDGTDDFNKNYDPEPGIETGCAGYYEREDASDKGMWRVPAPDEIFFIARNADILWDNLLPDQYLSYWSSRESEVDGSYAVAYAIPYVYNGPVFPWQYYTKTTTHYVRCVREPDKPE